MYPGWDVDRRARARAPARKLGRPRVKLRHLGRAARGRRTGCRRKGLEENGERWANARLKPDEGAQVVVERFSRVTGCNGEPSRGSGGRGAGESLSLDRNDAGYGLSGARGDIEIDVAVVGAGISGVMTCVVP